MAKAAGPPAEPPAEKAPDAAMDKRAMKKLLVRARKGPVSCALMQGDSKSGGAGLLLLHKVKPGKALLKELREQYSTAKNPCFGTVSVDEAGDPARVQLRVNKRYPGYEKRLVKLLRGTGFKTVTIETGEAEPEE